MSYKNNYVPKSRQKFNFKIFIPFIVIMFVLGIGVTIFMAFDVSEAEEEAVYSFCGFSPEKSYETVSELQYDNALNVAEVSQYGDNLGLYHEPYKLGTRDLFEGKTVFLTNLCTQEERVYMMNIGLDEKLSLQDLEKGFYSIEILDNLKRYRLVTEEPLDEIHNSISTSGYHNEVHIRSDKSLFKGKNHEDLAQNYLFLEVNSIETPSSHVDIILDPEGSIDLGWEIDYGVQYRDFNESRNLYDFSVQIKKILEAKGLKVDLARGKEEVINIHGDTGRLKRAYQKEAKYYLQFRVLESSLPEDEGVTILYSNYASNRLPTYLMKSLMGNSSLKPSMWRSGSNLEGVYQPALRGNYDSNELIRESGGLLTGAGSYDDDYQELNQSMSTIKKGMNGIIVDFGSISNDKAYNVWMKEKDMIAQSIAEGILKSFGLE